MKATSIIPGLLISFILYLFFFLSVHLSVVLVVVLLVVVVRHNVEMRQVGCVKSSTKYLHLILKLSFGRIHTAVFFFFFFFVFFFFFFVFFFAPNHFWDEITSVLRVCRQ